MRLLADVLFLEMRFSILVFTFCLYSMHTFTQARGFPGDPGGMERYEDVTIHHESRRPIRLSNSDYKMPEVLHIVVARKEEKRIKLRLKRSEQAEQHFSVYRLQEGQVQSIQLPNMTAMTGFYQGGHSNDFFLVRALADNGTNTRFSLHGTFWHDNNQYELTQSSMHNKTQHTIMKTEPIKYENDIIYPPSGTLLTITNRTDGHRLRRQSVTKRFVELAIVTDYAIYKRFMKFANNNAAVAESEMAQYYRYVAAAIDKRYQSITEHVPKLTVRVYLSSLTLCEEPSQCPWSTNNLLPSTDKIDYPSALRQFRDFATTSASPKGDHRMFITGYQMAKSDGKTGNLGVAYVGTVCTDWSASMIQDRFSGVTAGVGAHELGHSLGAFHDNHKNYAGCSNQDYVMNSFASFPASDSTASRPYFFSNCSAKSIADYLSGTSGSCTKNFPNTEDFSVSPAGQHFDADTQCAIYYGTGSKFCRKEQQQIGFDKMCMRLSCSMPDDPATCNGIIPLDRTSCGDRQWCIEGVCASTLEAPQKPKDCPQGDDPEMTCVKEMCLKESNNSTLCCQTCSDISVNKPTAKSTPTKVAVAATRTAVSKPPTQCNFMCQCLRKYSRSRCWFLSHG